MEEGGDAKSMEGEEEEVVCAEAMDRMSELPQFILHQILTYLSTKEASRTSVVSKTFFQAWSTTPILILEEQNFSQVRTGELFLSFVNTTFLRYRTQNLRIHKFKISLFPIVGYPSAYVVLDQAIATALDQGVKELQIKVPNWSAYPPYTLPQPILGPSAKALTDLTVESCNFPPNFTSNAIHFPLLKSLTLDQVHMDNDGALQNLLSSCPSVEKIIFNNVSKINKFLLSNLSELKILRIGLFVFRSIIQIEDVPSLHFLRYSGSYKSAFNLEIDRSQNLKHLELEDLTIPIGILDQLITKLPLLEVLNITYCSGLERIKVSGRVLKHLLLKTCKNLVEVNIVAPNLLTLTCENLVEANIETPNLLTFTYDGYKVLSLSQFDPPKELTSYINIALRKFVQPDNTWFHQLRKLLKSLSRANVSLNIRLSLRAVRFGIYMDLAANQLPFEDFIPERNQSRLSLCHAFVETLFSSYWPSIISTQKGLDSDHVGFIDILSKELIMAARNSYDCRCDEQSKCWRHYLKDVKVEIDKDSQNVWQPLSWNSLLDEPRSLGKGIRFSLEWNANLNVQNSRVV